MSTKASPRARATTEAVAVDNAPVFIDGIRAKVGDRCTWNGVAMRVTAFTTDWQGAPKVKVTKIDDSLSGAIVYPTSLHMLAA